MRLYNAIPLSKRMTLLDWVAGVPALRPPVWRLLTRVARRALVENNTAGYPPQVQDDKVAMLSAIMASVEHGLSSGLISPSVRRKLAEVYLGKVVFKPVSVRGAFRVQHGMVPPSFLTISPTARCNLRCTGCYAGCDDAQCATLPFPVFDRILNEKEDLWGSHFTVISGGEPFLYHDGAHGLLDVIERHPDQYFLIYTNGTLITQAVAHRLAGLGNVTPAISVEGFEKDTDARRGTGIFQKILNAFSRLRSAGVPFGISATVFRHNADYILDDEHIDFFFRREGALYAWIFQYMPIGRGMTLDLMLTPEQRLSMYKRTWELIRERGLFISDFWNCGTASNGCVAAGGGKGGGYFYIDWNGSVAPCVFNPFTVQNINQVYGSGGDLNTLVFSPFFKDIRRWQREYFYDRPAAFAGNLIAPCPFRDHHNIMQRIVDRTGAEPIDNAGWAVLDDLEYSRELTAYGAAYRNLSAPLWSAEYLGKTLPDEHSTTKEQPAAKQAM